MEKVNIPDLIHELTDEQWELADRLHRAKEKGNGLRVTKAELLVMERLEKLGFVGWADGRVFVGTDLLDTIFDHVRELAVLHLGEPASDWHDLEAVGIIESAEPPDGRVVNTPLGCAVLRVLDA